jgi:prepilin-type N-terminal cleavage/methylation domain-containing protein
MSLVLSQTDNDRGFTLIELLIAMTVFSFMLLIIMTGFINIIQIHNSAIASNVAQDNARTAMDAVVQAVRDSQGIIVPSAGTSSTGGLCLSDKSGIPKYYHIKAIAASVSPPVPAHNALYVGDNCALTTNDVAITNPSVTVADFTVDNPAPASVLKPVLTISLTLASNNGTTSGSGAGTVCTNNKYSRAFCSVVTLKSGAVAR